MYEILMALLAVIAVVIASLEVFSSYVLPHWTVYVDTSIWLIFVVDYVVRFFVAPKKLTFVKQNIFDLIAILPFSAFLRIFRMAKLFRLVKIVRITKATKLVKLFAVLGRFGHKFKGFLHTNGFIYVIYINIAVIILGGLAIYLAESGTTVSSFLDAIWWSFVTATTVGYGDISPATGIGRVIAIVLMLTGIGTISMLTSTLSTFFLKAKGNAHQEEDTSELLSKIASLEPEQAKLIRDIIENMKTS